MKLLFCLECQDAIKLQVDEKRTCKCKKSWGAYCSDGLHAVYGGPAILVGFANSSFAAAISQQPESGMGKTFEAFVIPKECSTVQKLELLSLKGPKECPTVRKFPKNETTCNEKTCPIMHPQAK